MKKYIFLTNIPAPYRISFFNELNKQKLIFEVYYMRNTEADRNWKIDQAEIKHSFYIDRGIYKMIGRFHLHFNPRIIVKLFKAKEAEFILGAGWDDLNVLLLAFFKRIGLLKNSLNFWSEANYLSIGALKDNIFKIALRKFVFCSSNGALIIPGKMAKITFEKWGIKDKTFIQLPNIIEEEKFRISEEEIRLRCKNNIPIFLMPVRLSEKVKGIINFFNSIEDKNIRKGLFLIAGEGPDKEAIRTFIRSHKLEENIKILGFCDIQEIVYLYKKANVFVLPSFSDPSPLTIVEALIMKLPILVSEKCGNHFEAVIEGNNGYLFNPLDPKSIKIAFEYLMLRENEWLRMGEISGGLYQKTFKKQVVVENFIRTLTEFSKL